MSAAGPRISHALPQQEFLLFRPSRSGEGTDKCGLAKAGEAEIARRIIHTIATRLERLVSCCIHYYSTFRHAVHGETFDTSLIGWRRVRVTLKLNWLGIFQISGTLSISRE